MVLDDVYIITRRDHAARSIRTTTRTIADMAGVQTHLGKREVWSPAGGPAPTGIADLSPTAWKGDAPHDPIDAILPSPPQSHGNAVLVHHGIAKYAKA